MNLRKFNRYMIKNTLLYYHTKNQYDANLSQINTSLAIAFVEDEGAIYTHGHKFGGSDSGEVLHDLEEIRGDIIDINNSLEEKAKIYKFPVNLIQYSEEYPYQEVSNLELREVFSTNAAGFESAFLNACLIFSVTEKKYQNPKVFAIISEHTKDNTGVHKFVGIDGNIVIELTFKISGSVYTEGFVTVTYNESGEVDIPDASVTTAKLANGAVTNDKLANEVKTAIFSKQDALNDNPETGNICKINGMSLLRPGNIEITPGGVVAQSDWTETDLDDPAYILHKPTIPQIPEIDSTPTPNSDNLITSGGVYNAINEIDNIETGSITDTSTYERTVYSGTTYYWCVDEVFNLNEGDSVIVTPRHVLASQTVWASDPIALIPVETGSYKYTAAADNMRITVGFTSADEFDYVITRRNSILDYVSNTTISCIERQALDFEELAMARQNIGIYGEEFGNDKEYNPVEFSGLGKVYLKKNIVEVGGVEKNILTQSAFYKEGTQTPNTDTVFVVQYDFDLNGQTVNVPANSVLEFDGGNLTNGSLIGDCRIINAPDGLYENLDCSRLYVVNERHLCRGDLMSLNDSDKKDFFVSEADTIDQQFVSSSYYCITGLSNIICKAYNSHVTTDFSIDYFFYDEDFCYVGRMGWKAKAACYQFDDIPEGAVYVLFKITTKGTSTPKIFPFLDYISFNFLNCTAVYIDSDNIEKKDVLYITTNNQSQGRVYNNNGVYCYSTWKDTPVDGYSRSSLYIPHNVLKNYDILEFVGHGAGVSGYVNGVVYFLKKNPTREAEPVDFSDWYTAPVTCYQSQKTNLIIPPDCKCIYIHYVYFSSGVPQKAFPKELKLKKKEVYGDGVLDTAEISSNRNVNVKEVKFLSWNIGADNLGGHLKSEVLTPELAAKRRNGFRTVLDRYNRSHNLLFNEYLCWQSDNDFRVADYLPTLGYNSTKYGMLDYGNYMYSNNAIYFKNNLIAHKIGWFDCLKGKVDTDGKPLYSNSYHIYRYSIGGSNVYVVHIHFPARATGEMKEDIYREIKSITSSFPAVIIVGDFNDTRIATLEELFPSTSWHIANVEEDNTPTHDFSSIGRVDQVLDYCIWRGSFIEVKDFKVITDAIIPGSEELAETEYYQSDIEPDDPRYIAYINHRLSDHWPLEFTVSINYSTNNTPSTRGNVRYNFENDRFEWHDGDNWIGCAKDSDLPSTGTTSQRPENARTGYIYYNTDTNSIEIYDGTEWMPTGGTTILKQTEPKLKILGVGDSVIRGWRNGERAFFEYLTDEYSKTAVSGARITTKSGYNVKDFVQQVIDEPGYDADAIIVGTGVNDWALDAPLGNLPSAVVTNDTDANALDRTKVYDAVQALFYQMVKKYPKAQKFFVSHFKFDCDVSEDISGKYTDDNDEGYSYAEMMEGVEQICKLYGVIYIDVLNKSFVNSEFAVYNAPTKYSEVADADKWSWNRTYYVDADGLHPTDLCYKEVFAKLIKPELNIGVAKHLVFSTKDEETFLDSNNNQIIVTE